jgi:hypothetical protein
LFFILDGLSVGAISLIGLLVTIAVSLGKEDYDTLIHDVQYDAVKGLVLHVDFYLIDFDFCIICSFFLT